MRLANAACCLLWITLAGAQPALDSEEMFTKAAALTKVSRAVQGLLREQEVPIDTDEKELLRLATRDDPGLLAPFAEYRLRVLRHSRNAIVLMCTGDASRGLLEDAGCTAKLDRHLWRSPRQEPCAFTLKLDDIC